MRNSLIHPNVTHYYHVGVMAVKSMQLIEKELFRCNVFIGVLYSN